MHPTDTIAAVATPAGPGGLAVLRISGRSALAVADAGAYAGAYARAHAGANARAHTRALNCPAKSYTQREHKDT